MICASRCSPNSIRPIVVPTTASPGMSISPPGAGAPRRAVPTVESVRSSTAMTRESLMASCLTRSTRTSAHRSPSLTWWQPPRTPRWLCGSSWPPSTSSRRSRHRRSIPPRRCRGRSRTRGWSRSPVTLISGGCASLTSTGRWQCEVGITKAQ